MKLLFRNSAKLLTANIVAQAVGLLVYPILSRIYSASDFGLLNLFLAIGSIFVLLSTSEYHYAVVLPKDEEHGCALGRLCVRLLLIWVFVLFVSLPFASSIATIFKTPDLARWWWLMPFYVLFTGLWNVLNYWYIRHEDYGRVSGYQVSQSLTSAGSKIAFGFGGLLHGGLLMSVVVGPFVSALLSVSVAWQRVKCLFVSSYNVGVLKSVARQYRNFPCFSLPRSLVNTFAGQIPIFLLTPIFGSEQVGYWGMAVLLGFAPVSMITRSLYQTFYQHITSLVNERMEISAFFHRFTLYVVSIVLPLFIGLYFVLPWLSEWLLGAEWRITGHYIRWMLPWVFCSVLTASTCFLSDVFFKQKLGLVFELSLALARVLGVLLGVILRDFTYSIAGYCIGSAIVIAIQYAWQMSLVWDYEMSRMKV